MREIRRDKEDIKQTQTKFYEELSLKRQNEMLQEENK